MNKVERVLVTGAAGKVGRHLIPALLEAGYQVRALQHNTPVEVDGAEIVGGSVSDAARWAKLVEGVDAICHLATTKEDPDTFIDVAIRGAVNLLEACRGAEESPQFILAGGDAALGIYFYDQPGPLDENAALRAYPGCYALSKALEEVLCQQYGHQYGVPWTVLRFSWIISDDDLLTHMMVREGVGVPNWRALAVTDEQEAFFREGRDAVGNLVHAGGASYIRHVVALQDVVDSFLRALGNPTALGQVFNVAAPAPFSYEALSEYTARQLDLPVVTFEQDGFCDFEIDVTKARTVLGCPLRYDAFAMIDRGIAFRQAGGQRREAKYKG